MTMRPEVVRGHRLSRWRQQGGHCSLCGNPLELEEATIDHTEPKSRGGNDYWRNLSVAHEACNEDKGCQMPHEYAWGAS